MRPCERNETHTKKVVCEELDQEGEERHEEEDTEKKKIKEQGGPSCKLF